MIVGRSTRPNCASSGSACRLGRNSACSSWAVAKQSVPAQMILRRISIRSVLLLRRRLGMQPVAFGVFPPDVRGSLGVEDSVYFTMEVQGMGGRNSLDVCQLVHESMLREADCLRESERLDFSLPTPSGATWEGAYADDHVVVQL